MEAGRPSVVEAELAGLERGCMTCKGAGGAKEDRSGCDANGATQTEIRKDTGWNHKGRTRSPWA